MRDPNTCEIRIYDRDFNWLNVARLAESVQFERQLYGAGSFEIHIHPDKKGAFELGGRDNIIIVNGDPRRAGIVNDMTLSESRDSSEFVITGNAGGRFLKQVITVPPTKDEDPNSLGWDKINAAAESVIKHYVDRNLVSAANANRNIANLVVAKDMARGKIMPWKSRYTRLSDELYNIGTYAEMGFEIYADLQNKLWVFDVIPGTDRTRGQSAVLSPVIFDASFHNMSGYTYSDDSINYRSTGYAGGAGEDENRQIYIIGDNVSGQDRWEEFLDCGTPADIGELIYYGEQKLNEFKRVQSVEANALPRTFTFGRDYFLGDKVSVKISRLGVELDTRITAVKEIWERDKGYRAEIAFGGELPNLFTILDKGKVVT
jgi:hypothetical protein